MTNNLRKTFWRKTREVLNGAAYQLSLLLAVVLTELFQK